MSAQPDYSGFLRNRLSLRLIWIINMGRGLPVSELEIWQDPLPDEWQKRFQSLKYVISNRRIHYAGLKVPSRLDRWASVDPTHLLSWQDFATPHWEWLRRICARWSEVNDAPLKIAAVASDPISIAELRPWLARYVEDHKDDAKKPLEATICAAVRAAFGDRPLDREKVFRPTFAIVKPPEWNRRGRKPANSA